MNDIPQHIAIIMDGNGRWAQKRGLPRYVGHRQGAKSVGTILRTAKKIGIKYITLFAFSSENFSRPKEEVDFLMDLFEKFLRKYIKNAVKNKIHFRAIGDLSRLPSALQNAINSLSSATQNFIDFNLTIALNYGSRDEIIHAIKSLRLDKNTDLNSLTWQDLCRHLYTKDMPDPDLIIRTSGELRLSNFLLLQSAYSEFFFTQTYWPDFGEDEFLYAIETYKSRHRRIGKI